MPLDELGPRLHARIGHVVIDRIDSVRSDGNDDVTPACQDALGVLISLITRNRLTPFTAGPLQEWGRSLIAGGMSAMEEDDQRKRSLGPVRIIDNGVQLHWSTSWPRRLWLESGIAEVVLDARHRKRSRIARIRGTVTGQSLGKEKERGREAQKMNRTRADHFSFPRLLFTNRRCVQLAEIPAQAVRLAGVINPGLGAAVRARGQIARRHAEDQRVETSIFRRTADGVAFVADVERDERVEHRKFALARDLNVEHIGRYC